jgi:hypothetical protein
MPITHQYFHGVLSGSPSMSSKSPLSKQFPTISFHSVPVFHSDKNVLLNATSPFHYLHTTTWWVQFTKFLSTKYSKLPTQAINVITHVTSHLRMRVIQPTHNILPFLTWSPWCYLIKTANKVGLSPHQYRFPPFSCHFLSESGHFPRHFVSPPSPPPKRLFFAYVERPSFTLTQNNIWSYSFYIFIITFPRLRRQK